MYSGITGRPIPAQPNILFIFTDQQSRSAISACGNPHLHTPHMDSIAANGVRFELAYYLARLRTVSEQPTDWSHATRDRGQCQYAKGKPGIPTMGEIFGDAGYTAAWAGAWGRLDGDLLEFKDLSPDRHSPMWKSRLGGQLDSLIADQAIEFIQRKHDRPFLLGVSLVNPHDITWWVRRDPVRYLNVDEFPRYPIISISIRVNPNSFNGVANARSMAKRTCTPRTGMPISGAHT